MFGRSVMMRLQGRKAIDVNAESNCLFGQIASAQNEFEISITHGLIFSHPKKMKVKVKKKKKKDKKKKDKKK